MTPPELNNLLEFLEETPEFIRSQTENRTAGALRLKPSQEEFSALEHVCHLRDIEQEGYSVRINKLLNEEEPFLPDINGDRLAEERDYNGQSFKQALNGFACARAENIRTIRTAPTDALQRTGLFEGVGSITLERLVMMMYEHDRDHRQELSTSASGLANDASELKSPLPRT